MTILLDTFASGNQTLIDNITLKADVAAIPDPTAALLLGSLTIFETVRRRR